MDYGQWTMGIGDWGLSGPGGEDIDFQLDIDLPLVLSQSLEDRGGGGDGAFTGWNWDGRRLLDIQHSEGLDWTLYHVVYRNTWGTRTGMSQVVYEVRANGMVWYGMEKDN